MGENLKITDLDPGQVDVQVNSNIPAIADIGFSSLKTIDTSKIKACVLKYKDDEACDNNVTVETGVPSGGRIIVRIKTTKQPAAGQNQRKIALMLDGDVEDSIGIINIVG